MENSLKILAVFQSDSIPENLQGIVSRSSIVLHHARTGAAALVLAGNSLYDLLVLEEPLADLPVGGVLATLQSFEWASAGAPALVMAPDEDIAETAADLAAHPARVVARSSRKQEIQRAISELLGVPIRSDSRMMVNVEVKTESNKALRCYQSENISESGLLLRGAQAIPIGMAVEFSFCLPNELEPLRGMAIVVRHSNGGEVPGVGLRFVDLGRKELTRLRRFVDQSLTGQPPTGAALGADASPTAGV